MLSVLVAPAVPLKMMNGAPSWSPCSYSSNTSTLPSSYYACPAPKHRGALHLFFVLCHRLYVLLLELQKGHAINDVKRSQPRFYRDTCDGFTCGAQLTDDRPAIGLPEIKRYSKKEPLPTLFRIIHIYFPAGWLTLFGSSSPFLLIFHCRTNIER